jgi:hypothetical protein
LGTGPLWVWFYWGGRLWRPSAATDRWVGRMVFGPDFRALRRLPSVAEFLIWVDDGLLPTGRCREPTDAPRSPSPAVARTEESPRMSLRSIPVTRTPRVLYRRVSSVLMVRLELRHHSAQNVQIAQYGRLTDLGNRPWSSASTSRRLQADVRLGSGARKGVTGCCPATPGLGLRLR